MGRNLVRRCFANLRRMISPALLDLSVAGVSAAGPSSGVRFTVVRLFVLVMGLATFASACSGRSSSDQRPDNSDTRATPPQSDTADLPQRAGEIAYIYTGTTDGAVVVEGTLFLDFGDGSVDLHTWGSVNGHWDLEIVRELPDLGEQRGTGPLQAGFDAQNVLTIALHPNYADNNVVLVGTFDDQGVLSGSWSYTKFTGPARTGEFVARPK